MTLMLGDELTPAWKGLADLRQPHASDLHGRDLRWNSDDGESHDEVRLLSADDLESVDWLEADREALAIVAELLSS